MPRLSEEDLRRTTLRRQFPDVLGRGPQAVLDLFGRLGPIQSQVPRSPFLTASSRLPGVSYAVVNGLFESYQLTKTSNLRSTVHSSTTDHFPALDAIARTTRHPAVRRYLRPQRVTPADIAAEIERYCTGAWRSRDDIVGHIRDWLARVDGPAAAAAVDGNPAEAYLWGHSGLLRRPKDSAWEKRTDAFRRTARDLRPELGTEPFESALRRMVRVHLGAYGPATREDLAFFFGTGLTQVDQAVRDLGDEVVRLTGPSRDDFLDLADPPAGGSADPGLRLLPEFDGLLVGYAGRNRTRFLTAHQLPRVWASVNGLFSPIVVYDGRIVATWKARTQGRRTDLEVSMLDPHPPLDDAPFTEPVADVARVLDLSIADVRVHAAE